MYLLKRGEVLYIRNIIFLMFSLRERFATLRVFVCMYAAPPRIDRWRGSSWCCCRVYKRVL